MFKRKRSLLWFLVYILVVLVVAGSVNSLMYLSIPTESSLDGPSWLAFWGSYLGGAIGCLPAIAALHENRQEARRQHKESEKSRRLTVLPVVACENSSTSFSLAQPNSFLKLSALVLVDQTEGLHDIFTSYDPARYSEKINQLDDSYSGFIYFELHNIGPGPALNVSLSCLNISPNNTIPLKSIGSNESKAILLCVRIPPEADNTYQVQYNIGITFNDIFGNDYVQIQPLACRKTQHTLLDISIPELINQ